MNIGGQLGINRAENTIFISIVIPYYNDPVNVIRCIDSVNRSAAALDHELCRTEIVVVDDKSPEPFNPVESTVPLTVIRHGTNRGAAAARNTGVVTAGGEYILFLDSDVMLDESHIRVLYSEITKGSVTILQGPTSHHPANRTRTIFHKYLAAAWNYYGRTNGTIAFFTQCALIRKTFFMETGGFSDYYRNSGGEEFDFARRLSLLEKKIIRFDERLVHFHHFDGLTKRLFKVTMRSRHILSIVKGMPGLPLRFMAESMMRSLFALLLNVCLLTVLADPFKGVASYLAAGFLWFFTDWKFSNHILTYQSPVTAVFSVLFRQLEYTAIHAGIVSGFFRRGSDD